jgi:hypothetical protein
MIPAVRSDDLRAAGVLREAGAGGTITIAIMTSDFTILQKHYY